MVVLKPPFLIFLGDVQEKLDAKTAFGLAHWRSEDCVGQLRLTQDAVDCDLPDMTPDQAVKRGARTLVIGVSPAGGRIHENWVEPICDALRAGLDVVSGLHARMADIDRIAETAAQHGRAVIDVRHPQRDFPIGNPRKRSGKRILTVGSDTCVGKKFTALQLTKSLTEAGVDARFRATGQTGLMISDEGIVIDAVVSDFVSGAVEVLSPDIDPDTYHIIEGQGAILHPSHSAVTLGLLHGAQPDYIVFCHVAETRHVFDWPQVAIPPVREYVDLHLRLAAITNPNVAVLGVSINSSAMSEKAWHQYKHALAKETGLCVVDPIREGVDDLIAPLLNR